MLSQTQNWGNPTIESVLNGGTSRELHSRVSRCELRESGAFFTSSEMASDLLEYYSGPFPVQVVDPACGAGDLLLAVASKFPLSNGLRNTLKMWGRYLAGFDLHQEFIDAALIRLAFLALFRGAQSRKPLSLLELREYFPKIRVNNSFEETEILRDADLVLTNPPFNRIPAPKNCSWTTGQTSNAAIFLDWCVREGKVDGKLLAILPEVLRSGALYEKWRSQVEKHSAINLVSSQGIFDSKADVDVFFLGASIQKCNGKSVAWTDGKTSDEALGDFFDVSVGAYVPFRANNLGPLVPYIHPRCVVPWADLRNFTETKKFSGTTQKGPFVVIRRTSRPGDKHRAIASLICSSVDIAIENHFIVCKPRDNTIGTCRRLLKLLKRKATTEWINGQLRCRHLTVGLVREIPWNSK